jgi:hypothetical protein
MPYVYLMELNGLHITGGKKMTTTKTYAELLKEVSVTVTPNDAAFLAKLVQSYIDTNSSRLHDLTIDHLSNLIDTLTPKAGC